MRHLQTVARFDNGLRLAKPQRWATDYDSKIGVVSLLHDCAFIGRSQNGKHIRYASTPGSTPSGTS